MPRSRLKDYLVIAGGILLIGLSLSFAHVNSANSAADETVRVVNTPLPVTLQGTGTITGTVASTQSGTWNVGATQSGTWNVGINNPASNPVPVSDVNAVVREPFQARVLGNFTDELFGSQMDATVVTVPTGKRLVIEHVSAGLNISNAGVGLLSIGLNNPATLALDQIICNPVADASDALNHAFQCAGQTKYYVEPGQELHFFAETLQHAGSSSAVIFVSGYYVPA